MGKIMRLLVVDDEKSMVSLMKLWMGEKGYDVDVAFDGKKALELIAQNQYDMVFMDHNMPEITGLELIRHVKEKSPATKTVMMTGYPHISSFAAKGVGADEYLVKPFTIQDAVTLIEKYKEKENG